MAKPKWRLLAVVAVIIVLSAAALVFALTQFNAPQMNGPNLSVDSIAPTPSPTVPNLPVTCSSSPAPTPTPLSTPAPSTAPQQTPQPTSSQVTSVNGTLQLTLSVGKTVYAVGEPVNVTLSITNISNQSIEFEYTGMNFDFTVANSTGNIIYQWSIGRAIPQFILLESLAPGQNVTATYSWSQITNTNPSTVGTLVSPGTYFIVGNSNPIYGLQTEPVQITIVNT